MSYYDTYDVYQPGDRVFIGNPGYYDGEIVEVDSGKEMYAVRREDGIVEWCHTSWLVWYDNDMRRGAAEYHNGSYSFAYHTEPPCAFGERTIIYNGYPGGEEGWKRRLASCGLLSDRPRGRITQRSRHLEEKE